ncbi:MAG: hypothetical protein WDZ41_02580 [Candidatus Babeliales bacterium]
MNKNSFLNLLGLFCIFSSLQSMENDPVFLKSESNKPIVNAAKSGNPEPMVFMMEDALEANKLKTAFKWLVRFKIRVTQDAACDALSVTAAMDKIMIRGCENPKLNEMNQKLKKEEIRKIFSQQVDWVQKKQTTGQFLGSSDSLVFSSEECKKKRQEVLGECRKQLSEMK